MHAGRTGLRMRSVLIGLLLAGAPGAALAQLPGNPVVVPIQVTGAPEARFSMVVLGDGYTAAEMDLYREQVDRHLNVMWSIEPFRSYRNYFNVYMVEIESPVSGITCDPEDPAERATPLQMQFSGGCTNPNARGINVDQNTARQYAALATPHFNQILVLANTDTYGGIGGAVATTSGGNAIGPLITPHELGHSLGRLQDEYTYSARGVPGGAFSGREPASIHHTTLTEQQMRERQQKWWRWLGEESEAGGVIGRYEGGMSNVSGIFRPSRHSMMISLGYYFDQVSRERMVERISAFTELVASSTPTAGPVARDAVLHVEPAQPVYHELDIVWRLDNVVIEAARGMTHLDVGALRLGAGRHRISATVSDPTPWVRDPAIREDALTATREWTVGAAAGAVAADVRPGFTNSTLTARPVGGAAVVWVATPEPGTHVLDVEWRLNGELVPARTNRRTFPLADAGLPPGTHTLSATVSDPRRPGVAETRSWQVDNTPPAVTYALGRTLAAAVEAGEPHYFVRDSFTMRLDATDDQPGHVVAEFRVNGDGWHHYYGWPDAPPGTPFLFTPRGTNIKELIYGSLSAEGLSPQPWEPREPGWGSHRIEYRAIDAAGNIGPARAFRVTLAPTPECTATVRGDHAGDLRVERGTTCLEEARVAGAVTVAPGAALVAVRSAIAGAVDAAGALRLELIESAVRGPLAVPKEPGSTLRFGSLPAPRPQGAAIPR
jgi:hypothetical protein